MNEKVKLDPANRGEYFTFFSERHYYGQKSGRLVFLKY